MERLFSSHMARHVSHIMGRIADIPLPQMVLKPLISVYSMGVGVAMEEVDEPEGGYDTFSAFFGRRLRPDARPLCRDSDAVVSPCDGAMIAAGRLESRTAPGFSIKRSRYDLGSLVGADFEGDRYDGGGYLVIYLHPRDYHRVHLPVDASLVRSRHIPGARFSVAGWSEKRVEGILGKNERMVFDLDLPAGGRLTMVMVAAFGVGNIDTEYGPGFGKGLNVCVERDFDPPIRLSRGEEIGAFLLGSTVVMVWSRNAFDLDDGLVGAPVLMGRRIGKISDKKRTARIAGG